MNITLQVVYISNPDTSVDADPKGYSKGYIVNVYRREEIVELPCPESRMIFIHLLGVPDEYNYLSELIVPTYEIHQEFDSEQGISLEKKVIINRRKWFVDFNVFKPETIAELDTNREVTKTWVPEYKGMLKSVLDNNVIITDEDLII